MIETRLYKILSRFVDVRPQEARVSFFLFLYFFLITFPAYIIKPVKEALLITAFNPSRYPLASLLTAALIGFVVSLNSKLLSRLPRLRYFSLTLTFFISNLILFRFLYQPGSKSFALIYWFWSDVFIATTVTQFWISVNDVFNPHETKRQIGFFVSGGLLGGIGGALLASGLARFLKTEDLLLVCSGILILTLAAVGAVYRNRPVDPAERDRPPLRDAAHPKVGYLESFRLVKNNRYLLLLAGVLSSAIIVSTLIQFQFMTVLKERLPLNKDRTSFLGTFYAALLVFSYVFHLFMTNRVLKKSGIQAALLIAPSFLILGSAVIFLVPAAFLLGWSVVVRGADKSLENSLSQSVRELLYIPVPTGIKYKAKIFIDLFVNKFAASLGALIFLFFTNVLVSSIKQISFLTIAASLIWILFARLVYREYAHIVKGGIERKWLDGDRIVTEHVDLDMTRLVFETIQSREKSSVLYAMNIFDLIRKDKITPEIKEIVSYKSDEIRAKSMGSLLEVGGETFFPDMGDVLEEEDIRVQINEIMALDSYKKVMADHLEKTIDAQGAEAEVARMEAAKVIGLMGPTPAGIKILHRLLQDPSPEVLTYALESAAKLRRKEFVPQIIRHLASPQTRHLAGDTLTAFGAKVIGPLKEVLFHAKEDLAVRRAVPAVLMKIGTQKAADVLTGGLGLGDGEIDEEIIEALHKLKEKETDLHIKKEAIRTAVMTQIKRAYAALLKTASSSQERNQTPAASQAGLPQSRIKTIFELLSLAYPFEDMVKAYQNLSVGTRKSIDYSLELLDNVLSKDLKIYLFPLLEDFPPEERVRLCRRLWKSLEKKVP